MDFATISSFVLPLIIAITLHEAAHGFAAYKLGDGTAKLLGRVTLDPLRHIDPFGTIILPGLLLISGSPALFGYAKPVPVRFDKLNNPRRDSMLVALAGPAMNILLAFISALLLHLEPIITPEQAPWMYRNIVNSVTVNALLAVFNMLPILPLDGGRVLNSLLPPALARKHAKSERYGILIVLALFMLPAFLRTAHIHIINFSYYLIWIPMDYVRDVILMAAGIGNG